jgi:uncharacterized membrane protein YgaE (UPF0421/DUF939 family)
MNTRVFRRSQPRHLGTAARAVAQRTPESLTLVRRRAQPTAVDIARLAATAVLAYLLALLIPGSSTSGPVLAPLTALLVVQVSLYHTVRNAVLRVASVIAGVLVAVGLSAAVGFTWWSLGLSIVAALALGHALRLGEHILEVPISAMLILSVTGTKAAATGRILETLVGAAAGLAAGLILAPLRVQPAEEAVEDLCRQLAGLLDQVCDGLLEGSAKEKSADWLRRARALGGEIERVAIALSQAEDSVRLNPRGLLLPDTRIILRNALETLEHAAIIVRVLTRTLVDVAQLVADEQNPLLDADTRAGLADVLRELAAAVRSFGRLVRARTAADREQAESQLQQHLAAARERQDRLSELLGTDPAIRPLGWPLRGEVISHLDRLRKELEAGSRTGDPQRRRLRSWRRPPGEGRPLPEARRQREGRPQPRFLGRRTDC